MPDSSPHSRRFDRVEILNRLKAVEAGEMTLYERELVEQLEAAQAALARTHEDQDEAMRYTAKLEEQLEAAQGKLEQIWSEANSAVHIAGDMWPESAVTFATRMATLADTYPAKREDFHRRLG